MKANGKIVSVHKNKHMHCDGFALEDGTTIKVPPHVGESLKESIGVGTLVHVSGHKHKTPHGDIHLHAVEIEADGYSYTFEAKKPPKEDEPKTQWVTKEQADEIITELKAIRNLLERRV